MNRIEVNKTEVNRVRVNMCTVNSSFDSKDGRVTPPVPEEITDALLMEDGSLFLMEDGSYFRLEN